MKLIQHVTLKFDWTDDIEELDPLLQPLNEVLKVQEKPEVDIDVQVPVVIQPTYTSISAIRYISEPWINIWSGDEWGEVMGALHGAIRTDYGLDDEDVARLCRILWKNVESMHEWMENEGHSYGLSTPEQEAIAVEETRAAREYWLDGGNIQSGKVAAKETIDSLPKWVFGEE